MTANLEYAFAFFLLCVTSDGTQISWGAIKADDKNRNGTDKKVFSYPLPIAVLMRPIKRKEKVVVESLFSAR